MASSIDVTALPLYVNEHKDELFVNAALGANTLGYVEIMPSVKYKDALNYLDSEVVLGDGSSCGWNPAGSDVFSQRTIEVKPIAINKEFCWKDFRKTYANHQLMFEAGREKLPFEQKIAESNLAAIKDAVETLVWQGSVSLGLSGFLAQIASEGTTDTIADGSTATAQIDKLVAMVTDKALAKGVNVFVAPSLFRKYVAEQNANCCANRAIIDAASATLPYVGDSRITIIPTKGLEGTSKSVASSKDGLVYGTDVEGSEGVYKMWYDEKADMMLFKVLFNAGTAIKFVDEVFSLEEL